MKLFYILILLLSSKVFSKSIECNNPKKLWGMNNEINGVTVSSVDIYMCFNDPLNIYNSNDNSNDNSNLKISNENLNILSYNNSIQKILNQSKSFYNDSYNISNISTFNPTTTTSTPTTTTIIPSTTSVSTTTTTTTTPTTTTTTPTTTTSTPTTTSRPTTTTSITTTTLFPITTTSLTTTSNINLTNNTLEKTNFNLRGSSKSLESNNEQQQHDIPLIIFITVLSSFACCISIGGFIYYKLKSKIKPSFVVEQKKEIAKPINTVKSTNTVKPNNINKINVKPNKTLHKNNVNNIINNIQTEKKALIKLQNSIGKQSKIQESIKNMKPEIKRKKSLTPKSKAIRGLVSHNSWYQDTFKDELNILKDSNNTPPPPPSSNNNDVPKLPIPKLQNKTQKNNVNMKISKKKNNIHPNIQQQYEKFNRQYNGKVRNKYN